MQLNFWYTKTKVQSCTEGLVIYDINDYVFRIESEHHDVVFYECEKGLLYINMMDNALFRYITYKLIKTKREDSDKN